ncbi:MAG: BACON domain-containing protein [Bacteroidales bacterium]|nr:BACON domain-containing protein [Bacteroidales bacterium]
MKKTLYILSALLLGLVSCTKTEYEVVKTGKDVEPTGLVAITMKADIPMLQAYTRALGDFSDTPSIKSIHVAVFGTSGYPQAYAYAEPVDASGNTLETYATENGETYYFKVLLPVYEGEAHVHIIANGPESIPFVVGGEDMDEDSIMAEMRSQSPVGAYWARIIMPDGILTQLDENGIMQTDSEGNYIPSDGTAHLFQELVLVRNFAEIKLSIDSSVENLTDVTWTVVNKPTTGSVAPMSHGFVDDYKDYEYDAETGKMVKGTKVYEGFRFEEDPLDISLPGTEDVSTAVTAPNFIYERPHPGSEKATCILVKGKFTAEGRPTDSYYTYYRIDLMDEAVGGYFPIYRNYRYQVRIHKVGNRGATSIEEAMNRDSGGNVSLSTEAQKLTDISDGSSRLYVEYVEKNFTSGGKKSLWVYYVPDVTTGVVDNSRISISIKNQGTALREGTEVTLAPTSTQTGAYVYEFELNEQDEVNDLVSVLQIKADNGKTDDDKSTLYRDITLRVMKKMNMTLSLVPKQVAGQGSTTVLGIGLPDDLPSSMFPLEIYIEDINHTLYSTGQDGNGNTIIVPVKSDYSIVDGTTNSFYFIRTVNESEYLADHNITTAFKTSVDASATTIYVANEYFKTQSINLLNDGMYVNPTKTTVPFNTTSVKVEVEFAEPDGKSWTVTAGSGITSITNEDGTTISGGTGNSTFVLNFPANNSTTASVTRTATVRYNGTDHTVTIIQSPLEFSITTDTPEVSFNATTATVTIHAEEGKAWTAAITGPNGVTGYSLSETSGIGTKTLTVTLPTNGATVRNYTITATMTDPAATATLTLVHRRQPNTSSTFNNNAFTVTNNTASANSSDGYITVDYRDVSRGYNNGYNYIRMSNGNAYGYATITPHPGVRITRVEVTGTTATYAGRIRVSSGTYSTSGTTRTWTVTSTEPITMTSTSNAGDAARITSIVVYYEPI